jgi:hypothetical protein
MKSNIAVLLQDKAFKELLLDLPDLNFRLLAMLDSGPASEPLTKKPKLKVSDNGGEERGRRPAFQGRPRHYFGQGRTLG